MQRSRRQRRRHRAVIHRVLWGRVTLIVAVLTGLSWGAIRGQSAVAAALARFLPTHTTQKGPSRVPSRVAIPEKQPTTPTTGSGTSPKPDPHAYVEPPPSAVLLRVGAQDQFPELPNGCEVTSLSMLLGGVGHPITNLRLAVLMPKDPTPRVMGPNGQIVSWGNPNVGFVGSVYVQPKGFGIYHGPMTRLIDRVLPGRAVDLTGQPFQAVLDHVRRGTPVEVWTTIPLSPNVPWVTWKSPEGPVRTTLDEHAVLVVGYSPQDIYINNPYNGQAAQAVPRARFIASWRVMGKQSITVRGLHVSPTDICTGKRIPACMPPAANLKKA